MNEEGPEDDGHRQAERAAEPQSRPDISHALPPVYTAPSNNGVTPELFEKVNEMQHQLQYASMVRSNYEKQLHQLSTALQVERISKGTTMLQNQPTAKLVFVMIAFDAT